MASARTFTGTVQVVAAGAPAAVVGLAVLDTSGAGNTVRVHAGTSTSGPLIAAVVLAANGAADLAFDCRDAAVAGVHVTCTGAVVGAVWVA